MFNFYRFYVLKVLLLWNCVHIRCFYESLNVVEKKIIVKNNTDLKIRNYFIQLRISLTSFKQQFLRHSISVELKTCKKKVLIMKIFELNKKNLSILGLGSDQRPFNKIQLKYTLKSIALITMLYIYLFYEAKTTKECMDAFLMLTEGMLIFLAFFCSFHQMANISRFIDMIEKMTEKREFYVFELNVLMKISTFIKSITLKTSIKFRINLPGLANNV